jgi:hypothetical protein
MCIFLSWPYYLIFLVLQDLVDQQMRDLGVPPAMQTVMGGKFSVQIICRNVNFRSEKEEDFYQVVATPSSSGLDHLHVDALFDDGRGHGGT